MSKGKKDNKGERNPLEGVTFDQLSDKEKQLARLILQSMETEVEQDAELSLPDAILKYAEENPDLNFSEKERQLIDKLKSEKSGGQVDAESQKPTLAEQLREGKKNLKHVEQTERPKASGPSFSELIADKAAEMREKRNANQKKSSTVKDDFLQVTENESGVSNSSLEVSANKPKSNEKKEVQKDTPENRLAAVLGKYGVTLSVEDKAIVTEMIHAVGVMDGRSDRVMGKVGTKLVGVSRLIKNYPGLKSNADEFCQVFESAAKNPKTVKFMQDNYLNEVREEHDASTSKPKLKTTNKSSTLAITDGLETQQVNQEQAVDSVIFSPSSKSKGGAKNITTSDAIDPITQAIRDEILKKQQELLKEKIAETLEGQEKEDFLKQDLTAIRSYLQTEEGKQAVDNAMKSPELRKQMHAIEREGYKTVHTQFQDSFRDVDWGRINEDKVRVTDVKDADGNPVCTLKETTVDTKPQSVTLADGTTQTINKYRKIDFPRELETGNGPMHVSMAVRDANGKPISKKEAVYFTAHYDDNGKLTEVSSPTPVHFAGDGPDAIGYIEVDGKVFTLPVTREKYQEMMQEVAKNNGLETQINQSVVQDKSKQNTLALENSPPKKTLAIEDSPSKKTKTQTLAIEDAPNKKPKVVEQESVQEQTEAQKLADKMRESRKARGNESAEPPAKIDSPKQKTEAQGLAEKMKQSRGDRSNEPAEPESRGGGKPVNVKKPKVVEKESGPELNEAQKMAKKMKKSRADRDNVVAEAESRGGGKAVNVKSKPKPKIKPLTLENPDSASLPDNSNTKKLLGAAKDLAEAVSDLTKNVKAAAQKGSRVNARTGKKVSETIAKLTAHTRGNVDPVIASGKKAKSSGKGVTVSTPNMAQNKSSGHSR